MEQIQEKPVTAQVRLEKKQISAKAARKITDETVTPLIHIYTCIRQMAKEGYSRLNWEGYAWDSKAKDRIIAQLKNDGYIVDVDKEKADSLIISW